MLFRSGELGFGQGVDVVGKVVTDAPNGAGVNGFGLQAFEFEVFECAFGIAD